MPAEHHYRDAAKALSNVLGADAAAEREAFIQSVEHIARAFELAERYQDQLHADTTTATLPAPRRTERAA
jgi:hypothetical protein